MDDSQIENPGGSSADRRKSKRAIQRAVAPMVDDSMSTPNSSSDQKKTTSDLKQKSGSSTIRRVVELIALAVAFIGCVGVIPIHFYVGLGIMDVGTLVLVAALLYEEKHLIRFAVLPLLCLVGYLNYFLLRPCPMNLIAMSLPIADSSGLPPDIEYRRDVTYLRVGILNDSADNFSDVDITLKPDVPIQAIGAYSDVQTSCTLHGDATKEEIWIGTVQLYSPAIEQRDANGRKTLLAAKQLAVPQYRIVCSQIMKHSSIDFIVAVGTLNRKATTGVVSYFFAKSKEGEDLGTLLLGLKEQSSNAYVYDKSPTQKIAIDAKYVAHFKPFETKEARTVMQQ
jgi:hypothetical protein